MSTALSPSNSSDQAISLRVRDDLVISSTIFQGETSWVIKDPLSLKYFRLRDAEYQVLKRLDGHHSYRDIKRALARSYPNKKFEIRQLQQLVESFHGSGLLLTSATGQSAPLKRRGRKEKRQRYLRWLTSIVAIRFPGVDPDRFLSWLYPKVSWLFSKTATAIFAIVITSALLLVGTQFAEFQAKLPEFQQFFGLNNLVYMGVILIATKSIHELGHGIVCKHFRGECHEIGFMLMVLTPAMYCDTSDSWILPNKWHRIAIGAAGMWLEVVLAAMATFVWWYTEPGWLHYLSLNVMFLCSVATIVFNINPLLRYDGYYMLADYLEIPNLSQKANLALVDKLRVWCLGLEPISKSRLPQRQQLAFAAYSVSSFFYRWFILIMIFWFISKVFEPYGLQIIGYLAITISVSGAIVFPIFKAIRFLLYPGRLQQLKGNRVRGTTVLVAAGIAAFCLIPFPHDVMTDFVVRPASAESLFVGWPGNLRTIEIPYGQSVKEGDVIARLENLDLQLTIEKLDSELKRNEAMLKSYRIDTVQPLQSARLAAEARAKISQLKRQLAERHKQQDQLTIIATRDGVLMPPPNVADVSVNNDLARRWSGYPLSEENVSARFERKTLLGYLGEPEQFEAILAVNQSDVKFLQVQQRVTLTSNSSRNHRIVSTIDHVSSNAMETLPRELSLTNGGSIASEPLPSGGETTMLPLFEATVQMNNDQNVDWLPGMIGKAKVRVGSASLGSRTYRVLVSMFRFR